MEQRPICYQEFCYHFCLASFEGSSTEPFKYTSPYHMIQKGIGSFLPFPLRNTLNNDGMSLQHMSIPRLAAVSNSICQLDPYLEKVERQFPKEDCAILGKERVTRQNDSSGGRPESQPPCYSYAMPALSTATFKP